VHDDAAEQSTYHLLVRQLVGVIPKASRVGCDPAVGVVLAHAHGVLGDPGDPVLGVRDVDPVPVQGHSTLHRLVVQPHLDQLADRRLDEGSRRLVVQGVALHGLPRCELHLALTSREVDDDIGPAFGLSVQVGNAHGRAVRHVFHAVVLT
jgi:hypothetical protein